MRLLGIDLGTSSVKVAVLNADTGSCVASAQYPDTENPILSLQQGWAEQSPEEWWQQVIAAIQRVLQNPNCKGHDIAAIGIAYQMHGLVCVDGDGKPVRNSIIWCDSRAVPYGEKAFQKIGPAKALEHLLNSPGNFTAAKLAWVKENEPENFKKIRHVMLPGDYIAYRLTNCFTTTPSALSEGVFWDFRNEQLSGDVMDAFGFDPQWIPEQKPVFSVHGILSKEAALLTGLKEGTPVTYKAGDQPNNAFSLNVLNPGEMAATAGTSGVVYGVMDKVNYDPASRVNNFLHVNHRSDAKRIGVLLCVNGTGILNSWLRKNVFQDASYDNINKMAAAISPGADQLLCYPFGNGAERILGNQEPGASFKKLNFNRHTSAHIARSAQEGIVFALKYGIEVMMEMGLSVNTVRAGHANLFLSPVFREVFASVIPCKVELYNTDGAMGAARAAGWGAGVFSSIQECFRGMECTQVIEPVKELVDEYGSLYSEWKSNLPS
jgi:xylulokinase